MTKNRENIHEWVDAFITLAENHGQKVIIDGIKSDVLELRLVRIAEAKSIGPTEEKSDE